MGVLNVTPDSFFDGGRWFDPEAAIAHGMDLIAEGADIVDVGGESSRPGAEPVEEAEALLPAMAHRPVSGTRGGGDDGGQAASRGDCHGSALVAEGVEHGNGRPEADGKVTERWMERMSQPNDRGGDP